MQGNLEGSIQASDRVDLKQSAVVTGDMATQRISIDEGVYFKGRVNIQREASKKEVVRAAATFVFNQQDPHCLPQRRKRNIEQVSSDPSALLH